MKRIFVKYCFSSVGLFPQLQFNKFFIAALPHLGFNLLLCLEAQRKGMVIFMTISSRGRYALRLMIDLAQHNTGEYISLKDISSRQEISLKYLEQIVVQLSKAGFLKSARRALGGYKLAKAPYEYTVGSILRSTEGNLSPVGCLELAPNQCPRSKSCHSIKFWQGLYDTINQYVDSVTLQDLLALEHTGKKAEMPVHYL